MPPCCTVSQPASSASLSTSFLVLDINSCPLFGSCWRCNKPQISNCTVWKQLRTLNNVKNTNSRCDRNNMDYHSGCVAGCSQSSKCVFPGLHKMKTHPAPLYIILWIQQVRLIQHVSWMDGILKEHVGKCKTPELPVFTSGWEVRTRLPESTRQFN